MLSSLHCITHCIAFIKEMTLKLCLNPHVKSKSQVILIYFCILLRYIFAHKSKSTKSFIGKIKRLIEKKVFWPCWLQLILENFSNQVFHWGSHWDFQVSIIVTNSKSMQNYWRSKRVIGYKYYEVLSEVLVHLRFINWV